MTGRFSTRTLFYLGWTVAIVATLGSLYFSEVMHLPPCILCWYQRILLYPQVLLFAVGIFRQDKNLPYYILPLSILGMLIATYHNLLYYHILPESIAPCREGISCTVRLIEWFGFLTIPLLSFLAFTLNTLLMLYATKRSNS